MADQTMGTAQVRTEFTTSTGPSRAQAPAGPGRSVLAGELATVGDLHRQANHADALAEQIELLATVIRGWARDLPDRVSAAAWGTTGIAATADAIAVTADDLPGLSEQLVQLAHEVDQAERLGEHVAARGAEGLAEAFIAT